MTRRPLGLLVSLALGLLMAPFVTDAQRPAKVWRIGYLTPVEVPRATCKPAWTRPP